MKKKSFKHKKKKNHSNLEEMSYFYQPSSIRLDRHILEAFKWKDVELKKNSYHVW